MICGPIKNYNRKLYVGKKEKDWRVRDRLIQAKNNLMKINILKGKTYIVNDKIMKEHMEELMNKYNCTAFEAAERYKEETKLKLEELERDVQNR